MLYEQVLTDRPGALKSLLPQRPARHGGGFQLAKEGFTHPIVMAGELFEGGRNGGCLGGGRSTNGVAIVESHSNQFSDWQGVDAWMAREFLKVNNAKTRAAFTEALQGIELTHEPHVEFKKRVPHAIGLIRTGDTTQYANLVLDSA